MYLLKDSYKYSKVQQMTIFTITKLIPYESIENMKLTEWFPMDGQ